MNVDVIVHVPTVINKCMSRNMFYVLRRLNLLIGCGVIVYGKCILATKFQLPRNSK